MLGARSRGRKLQGIVVLAFFPLLNKAKQTEPLESRKGEKESSGSTESKYLPTLTPRLPAAPNRIRFYAFLILFGAEASEERRLKCKHAGANRCSIRLIRVRRVAALIRRDCVRYPNRGGEAKHGEKRAE